MAQYRLDLENELKQSPIDDSAIFSSIEKVTARHNKHLEKSKRRALLTISFTALLLIGVIALLALGPLSETFFHTKTANTAETPLVEGDGIRIMPEEFFLYKSGVALGNQQPGLSKINVTDEQIVENLIMGQLTVRYAKKLGLTVSPKELDKEISFQRDSLKQASNDNPVKQVMAKRIEQSGLTEDEFWRSELIRRKYEESILKGKLYTKLIQDGTIKSGDGSEFGEFQKKLLAEKKEKLTINWSTVSGSKAQWIERIAHPYENVKTLTGTAVIQNQSLSQKVEFQRTKSSNGTQFSFTSPGATSPPTPFEEKATRTFIAPMTTLSWLASDINLWSIEKPETYLGRNAHVLEGKLPLAKAQQWQAETFKLWLDDETSMVLKMELYDSKGDVVESIAVKSLQVTYE
ncbi:hypothetical protein E5161_16185 [Cohnella pontilimi]|uniref:MucB/RseB N-terminal domain-containing protein n=1 Tax=Cohnella pontilimi TaxID=2564100 RepID=A0A4U0F814_9BACL|nr:SurA N-terminal domain-containing protein [Cohnella pontilimi]TJY40856.1 hypothetical protein E5161_16185 [Cohnella pontilimi]